MYWLTSTVTADQARSDEGLLLAENASVFRSWLPKYSRSVVFFAPVARMCVSVAFGLGAASRKPRIVCFIV